MHHQLGKRNRPLAQKSFWSRGYFVRTVGIDEETVKRYIQGQWQHDQGADGIQLDFQWN
ncbi:MAG: transposase [Patescibacteria group bacterium]